MLNYEKIVTETTGVHLRSAARSLAQLVSAEELDLFHTVEDMGKPEYGQIKKKLMKFGEDYNVFYAYYWRDNGDGRLQYIIDNDTVSKTTVGPGNFEKISDDTEFAALAGNIGVTDLGSYTESWEGLLSAYAPVYDKNGDVYCVAGVDISDEFIFTQRRDARNMKIIQLLVIPIAVFLGILNMLLYRKKAKQIEAAHIKLQYFNNNMRRAFSTYLSEDVVEEIVSDPTRLQLGGEKRHMTAIFTDIKGFTGIAEVLSPEQLVELLNHYLSTMSDVILEKEGTIDKYEGDAIIAFFGAPLSLPDHALRACMVAIIMKRLESQVNKHIAEHNLSPMPLYTRIGINSGDMVVGNMGTQKKMNYTIVSNAVNLAARLEGVNKQYGTWILASEDTVKETHGRLLVRRLDRIRAVGINEPVRIYEILETNADATRAMHRKVEFFHAALNLFEERRWQEAAVAFDNTLIQFPDDAPSHLYIGRCQQFMQSPPTDDWDGVFNLMEK
jgi:class 3 adenylate cyclase